MQSYFYLHNKVISKVDRDLSICSNFLRENLPVSHDNIFCPMYPSLILYKVSCSNMKVGNNKPPPQAHDGKSLLFSSFWDLIITHQLIKTWADLFSLVKYFQPVQSMKFFQSYLPNSVFPEFQIFSGLFVSSLNNSDKNFL